MKQSQPGARLSVPLHCATLQAVLFRLGARHSCQHHFVTLLIFAALPLLLRLYTYTAHINLIRSDTSTHICTARWLANDVITWGIQHLISNYKSANLKKSGQMTCWRGRGGKETRRGQVRECNRERERDNDFDLQSHCPTAKKQEGAIVLKQAQWDSRSWLVGSSLWADIQQVAEEAVHITSAQLVMLASQASMYTVPLLTGKFEVTHAKVLVPDLSVLHLAYL